MASKTVRIEARFMPEVKQLAERAAAFSGLSLTDYLAKLVRDDAPRVLKTRTEIQLTNEQFDNFLVICQADSEPSQALKDAAKRLDEEGF